MRAFIASIAILLLAASCSKEKLGTREYVQWVENEDNGLRSTVAMNEYKITLQYKPVQYVIALEEKKEQVDQAVMKQRSSALAGMQYYNLRLQSSTPGVNVMDIGINDEADYAQKVNYFTFDMQNDIQLVDGNDTLSCRLYQFERTYDLAPYIDFVLAFDKPAKNENGEKVFIFDGSSLGIGPVKFRVTAGALSGIPELTTY